ncbi:MAG: exodeoxyribonuclease III [Gammaproteobacteria bacterium]|nr:exodeoxyribonuclease III [Gammaproteobacteria bacterium]
MKIATWNVNSLRVRLSHLLDCLVAAQPDIVALQETKLPNSDFPLAEIQQAGYQAVFSGQRTYNGVAILSRTAASEVVTDIPGLDDEQRRILAVSFNGLRVVNVYIPNGACVGSDKYHYKLAWLEKLTAYLHHELERHPRLVLLGDFNIAPEDHDVHDPKAWEGQVLVSEPERAYFRKLLDLGFADSFRLFEQAPETYSWWDYRMGAFRRNMGLRIDHIMVSSELRAVCRAAWIDKSMRKLERPSDHAPVFAELEL